MVLKQAFKSKITDTSIRVSMRVGAPRLMGRLIKVI